MLMIRFQRTGRKNDASFRISLLEKERAARAGRIVASLGSYNPKTKVLSLDEEATKGWIAQGAQPTDTVRNLLISKGILEGKKVAVFPASGRKKMAEAAAKAAKDAADAAAAKAAAEAAPVVEEAPVEEPVVEEAAAPSEEAVVEEAAATEEVAPAEESAPEAEAAPAE